MLFIYENASITKKMTESEKKIQERKTQHYGKNVETCQRKQNKKEKIIITAHTSTIVCLGGHFISEINASRKMTQMSIEPVKPVLGINAVTSLKTLSIFWKTPSKC